MRDNKVNVLKKMLGISLVAPIALSLSLFAADPIHHWELDETNGSTYVDSIGEANGTCTDPGCPMPSDGQVYGAQSFDGMNDVIEVNGTAFDWTADANITIEFWMKSSSLDLIATNDVIIGRSDSSDVLQWFIGIDASNGKLRTYIIDGGASVTGNKIIKNDNWNHIAYVLKPGMIKIYVNGAYDFNISRSGPTDLSCDTNVTIGSLNYLSTNWSYIGQLDDIMLYNTDLNASTIQQHYLNGLKPHLVEVTPVPTPTDDDTPSYTFSSDKNGTIKIGGSCSDLIERNATAGNNTITFDVLPDGTYNDCTISVTSTEADTEGNVSDPLAVSSFVVDTYVTPTTPTTTSDGGGCTYNPDSKNFDMMFLLMMALGLFYPFRKRFIK